MARKKRSQPAPTTPEVSPALVILIGVLLLLIEIVMVPTLSSPFRLPKLALLVGVVAPLAGLSLTVRIFRTGRVVPRSLLAICLVAYPALAALSIFWSAQPRWALWAAITAFGIIVIAIWVASLTDSQRTLLIRFAAAGVLVSCGVLLLQTLQVSPMAVDEKGRGGLTGLTGNPSDLATAAILLLPLMMFRRSANSAPQKVEWILSIVLSISVLATRNLTGTVALAAFWSVVLIQYRHSRRAWAAAGFAVIAAAVIAIATGVGVRALKVLENVQEGRLDQALTSRTEGWAAGTEMFRSSPLLGVGAANYTHSFFPSRLSYLERAGERSQRGDLSTHFEWAHNDPLQVSAELGLLGAAWLLGLAASITRLGRQNKLLLLASAAAFGPFLLLHYPMHIAVGLVPACLLLGELCASGDSPWFSLPRGVRLGVVPVGALIVLLGMPWALRQYSYGGWLFRTNAALGLAESLDSTQRTTLARRIEDDAFRYATVHSIYGPEVLRIVGKCRLLQDRMPDAEKAFREAFNLWPHEEAEFGLGLALAAQGRRSEAIPHLANVVRVNARLGEMIPDRELRRAVDNYLETSIRLR